MSKDEDMLAKLVRRGDRVSVIDGKLHIEPASGKPLPQGWLQKHSDGLLTAILKVTGEDAYLYDGFSTGRYSKHKKGGVTLQFTSIVLANDAYVIFNVDLDYVRGPRKGKALPGKQFRVRPRHLFYKFWTISGIPNPPRLSQFHDYMGKLRGTAFHGNMSNGRFDAASLSPLRITHARVARSIQPDTIQTTGIQHPDKSHTTYPYKEIKEGQLQQGVERLPTTCHSNHDNKVIRETCTRVITLSSTTPPQRQTHDEWLADYDK